MRSHLTFKNGGELTMRSLQVSCCFLAVSLMGCGGGGDDSDRLETVPVSGTVTLDGSPFGPGSIEFVASVAENTPFRNGVGQVESDGDFEAGSYEEDDGLAPGEYQVRLLPSTEDPTATAVSVQPLSVTIPSDGVRDLKIDLVSGADDPAGDLLSPSLKGKRDSTAIGADL